MDSLGMLIYITYFVFFILYKTERLSSYIRLKFILILYFYNKANELCHIFFCIINKK